MEKKESAKERILRVASDLFYYEGIRAVGIDRIIMESGVAKASFYRNFATKDDLAVEYLDHRFQLSLATLEKARQAAPDTPIEQIYSMIDYVAENMKKPDYRGCPYLNAVVEFPESDHSIHVKAVKSSDAVWDKIFQMVQAAKVRNPIELSEQLRMLYNGAKMVAYVYKSAFKPEYITSAAHALIKKQLEQGRVY